MAAVRIEEQVIAAPECNFDIGEAPQFLPIHQSLNLHEYPGNVSVFEIQIDLKVFNHQFLIVACYGVVVVRSVIASLQVFDDVLAQGSVGVVLEFNLQEVHVRHPTVAH